MLSTAKFTEKSHRRRTEDVLSLLALLTQKDAIISTKDAAIEQKDKALAYKDNILDKKDDVIAEQKKRIALLEEYLRLEKTRRFGPNSEKNPNQGELFNEAETLAEDADASASPALEDQVAANKRRGRKGLSSSLPRHQVHLTLSDEEKAGAVGTFFTKVKEELDIVPAKAQVIEYLQEKAVFVDDAQGTRDIKAAELPKHPLNKCIASVALLAYVVVSKYCDGLPLYGLEAILKRYGGEVTRTSMANWVIRLAIELQPLVNLLRDHQHSVDYLQMDVTRIKVLKEKNRSPSSHKWMWVSKGGPPDRPAILFDYDPSRGQEVAERLLAGFTGTLQCDGLNSYDAVWSACGRRQLGCFDHARRKFVEAIKAQPKTKKTKNGSGKVSKADVALGKINALYRIERDIKDLSPAQKYHQRQQRAVPLLNDLKTWLESNLPRVVKGELTYKAIFYSLNQWDKLIRYCEDGRFHISNVAAENALRPFVIGRKRWLFSDTPKGAHASAVHYSLVETAKANGLDPQKYYAHILPQIPYADTAEKWEALLPWNVKEALKKNSP